MKLSRMSSPEPDPRKNQNEFPVVKEYGGGKFEMITPNMLEDEKMKDFFRRAEKPKKSRLQEIMGLLGDLQKHQVDAVEFAKYCQMYKKEDKSYREMMEMFVKESGK